MPTVKLSPIFNGQTLAPGNAIASGYKLFTYAAGSSTKQATYTDNTGITAHTNPILIDANGYTTGGPIWLISGQNYKFVLALPTDTDPPTTPIETFDYIAGVNDTVSGVTQWVASGVTPTYLSTTSFSLAGDQTAEFHVGRRIQLTVSAGTMYATIVTSTFGAGITTVVIALDTGVLDVGLSAVSLSILRADRLAIPVNAMSMAGASRNATMNVTAASATGAFTASEVIVESTLGGVSYKLASFSQSINLTVSGAGGMDTGTAPINGYVALYAIFNPTTLTRSMLAVNATSTVAPPVYAGAFMPSGYGASALVSVWSTDAAGLLKIGCQDDRSISFVSANILNTSTPALNPTALSLTANIPPNTKSISGTLIVSSSAASGVEVSLFATNNTSGVGKSPVGGTISAGNSVTGSFSKVKIITQQTTYYGATASAGTLSALANLSGYDF